MTHMLDFLEIREILEFSKNSQEAFQKDSHHAKILFATSDRTIGLKSACEIIHPERISPKSMIFRILIWSFIVTQNNGPRREMSPNNLKNEAEAFDDPKKISRNGIENKFFLLFLLLCSRFQPPSDFLHLLHLLHLLTLFQNRAHRSSFLVRRSGCSLFKALPRSTARACFTTIGGERFSVGHPNSSDYIFWISPLWLCSTLWWWRVALEFQHDWVLSLIEPQNETNVAELWEFWRFVWG